MTFLRSDEHFNTLCMKTIFKNVKIYLFMMLGWVGYIYSNLLFNFT
jgi:hypothetical protein